MDKGLVNTKHPRILVIGAGACGLTCAVCIQERFPNTEVEVIADTFSPDTTSDGSGGLWYPFLIGRETNYDVFKKVAKDTFDFLVDLAHSPNAKETGTQMLSGYYMYREKVEVLEQDDELVKEIAYSFRRLTEKELDLYPFAKDGFFVTTVQVDVTPFLTWLMKRFLQKGGKVTKSKIESLEEVKGAYDVVVNCTGLGARDLFQDTETRPMRGQLWRANAPWVKHFYILMGESGSHRSSYVIPGVNQVVIGGTKQIDNWNTNTDQEDSQRIWEDALQLLPQMTMATPIKQWAGLRPYRPGPRLESETLTVAGKQIQVVHNYGHGGSGITLCWGCAKEVVRLIENNGFRADGKAKLVEKTTSSGNEDAALLKSKI